jgi:hypothetical protein
VARAAAAGLTQLARVAPPAGVAVLVFAQTFVRGALTVLIAVLAVKTLALGTSAVGWLNAAIGAGGRAGAAAAAGLVRVTQLGRSFIGGLLLWGAAARGTGLDAGSRRGLPRLGRGRGR